MSTIRGRLLLLLLVGQAIVVAAAGASVYLIARAGMVRQLDRELKGRVNVLAPLVAYEHDAFAFEFDDWPPVMMAEDTFEFRERDGGLLRQSPRLKGHSLPLRQPLGNEVIFEDVDLPAGISGRAAWMAVHPRIDSEDDEVIAEPLGFAPHDLIVVTAIDRSATDRALATLLTALGVAGGALALTLGGLVLCGVPWGLAPLDRLSRQLESVSDRTLSKRFDGDAAPGELKPIYRELNGMLDRIERTIDRERSFADAAAHELRTPLAELRTTADVALRWPDHERAIAALDEAQGIGREMESMVESLLSISRGSAAVALKESRRVPLAPLVRECVQRSETATASKNLRVTVDVDDDCAVSAPREAVEIIVRNLIDNAVQYTPERGEIRIRNGGAAGMASMGGMGGTGGGASALMTIENGPVHLTPEDVPRLFEPFWRKDEARGDRTHAGLGLAVVQRIAAVVGLHIDAELTGERLRMRLSVKQQPAAT